MKLNPKTLIITGGVVAAMALEGVMFLLLMPSPPTPAAGETAAGDGEEKAEAPTSETKEEPIGEQFNCTNNQQESIVHLRFKVAAVVKSGQEIKFREMFTEHKTRVRQAIESIARRASRDDLEDPNLSTLKRLIREEVNKVLGKSFIIEAVIHDFSMIEQ